MSTDAALLARAVDGDAHAFAELVTPARRRMWAVCLRTTGNQADAEDALQEALIAAWHHLGSFRGDARLSTWLYRIASNAALALVRRRPRAVPVGEALGELIVVAPGDHAEELSLEDAVRRALAALPEAFREAIVLREYGALTYEEIAAHQGVALATVKTRIHRARALLAQELAPLAGA
ncbi:RNA polymerase sigma factor [Salana multivorans]